MKLWQIITGVGVVLALIGSFFVIESRWNQTEAVHAAEKQIILVKDNTVKTFKDVHKQIQRSNEKLDKKFTFQMNSMQYDTLTEQYYRLKKEIKKNPTDRELREEFEDVKKRRVEAKKQMEDSIK